MRYPGASWNGGVEMIVGLLRESPRVSVGCGGITGYRETVPDTIIGVPRGLESKSASKWECREMETSPEDPGRP